jgi:hypothetical protein
MAAELVFAFRSGRAKRGIEFRYRNLVAAGHSVRDAETALSACRTRFIGRACRGDGAMFQVSILEVSMSLRERLNDPGLFREQASVGGAWVDADAGATPSAASLEAIN